MSPPILNLRLRRLLAPLAALSLTAAALAGCATGRPAAPPASPSSIGTAPAERAAGVAAANDPRAGTIGEAILRRGGSAADAAVAMMFALSVIEPQSTSLGGGGFLVLGDAKGKVETYDGRETAPAAASPDWFLDADGKPVARDAAVLSGLSIGVPGNVALAGEAWRKHGRLPWAELIAPAIVLARDGFPVTPRLSGSLATFPESGARDPAAKAMFYVADGSAPGAGTVVRLPDLAATLEMIARRGPESFYSGRFAAEMAARIAADTPHERGMTAADIAAYRVKPRDPVCLLYRLYRVCTMGPPSSGGYAVLAILKQLEPTDLAALGLRNPVTWHLFLEAQRLAYADRARFIADPAYVDVPLGGLLDPQYLAGRAALIDPAKAMPDARPGQPAGAPLAQATGQHWPEHGTTHFVAVDADGDMASFTSTVEASFGSGLSYGGFYLNNEMTDFAFAPEAQGKPAINRMEAGKRPASSMSPVVIYDPQGRPWFSVGAAGGSLIPVETAHAIIGVIDFDLPLREALGLPFVMALGDDTVLVEQGTWMEELGPAFLSLGHRRVKPFGDLLRTTGALRTSQGWQAAFDPRLDPLVAIPAAPKDAPSVEAGFSEGQRSHD